MVRTLKSARRQRKNKTKHGFSVRNIPGKNFINFFEGHFARRLVSVGQTFMRGDDVIRVTSHLSETIDLH